MKGVMNFGRREKLSPMFIGLYEILREIREVAYEIALPPTLSSVYHVFHVSMLRRQVRRLRSKKIPLVKVKWRHRLVVEDTWET
ncbi:hypothetical protein MTR67_043165 [Solanum verrucosum]|uniref:Tf2-1-like SH3-like domain-containing protein n=1 Tax=Solanum verrucosum TaxID=315347 RepID=A0AAF0UNL2_SOLVR|nr:hypothetical protein MTR67_043165 [Solanum verrucosum]